MGFFSSKRSALFEQVYREITTAMLLYDNGEVTYAQEQMPAIAEQVKRLGNENPKELKMLGRWVNNYASGAPPQAQAFMQMMRDEMPANVF